MNKIDRKTFKELIDTARKYRRNIDSDKFDLFTLNKLLKCCDLLNRKSGIEKVVFDNISNIFAILKTSDEKIEEVMKILGFELIDRSEYNE